MKYQFFRTKVEDIMREAMPYFCTMLLTSFSKGSGCGCKINPEALKELLKDVLVGPEVPGLLVGNSMADDCSVFDLGDGKLLLQTVDFFTPVVNDPYVFGAAAAANALSDIWAMGGKPLMANAVFSWPLDKLPLDMGREVIRGASEICAKAGIPIAGGHSIDGQEPIFGLSVTGTMNKMNLKQNSGAKSGDLIYLTKPLGTGILAAAHKRGQSSEDDDRVLFQHLQQLNNAGEIFGAMESVHAMTDVTGFGLAGHLLEICRASGIGATLKASALPKIPQAEPFAASFVIPDNATRNWNAYEKELELMDQSAFPWIVDPQTNGGLLIAADPAAKNELEGKAYLIGEFTGATGRLRIV